MGRHLRELVPGYDGKSAAHHALMIADAVTPPRWVGGSHTPRGNISQASRMPNPPRWLEELDLTPWAANRVANINRMRRR